MDMSSAYTISDWKTEEKKPLGRPSRRWDNNIRLDLMKVGWEVVNWIHLAQNSDQWWALVNTVINLRGP
jgi:hypothetical protein